MGVGMKLGYSTCRATVHLYLWLASGLENQGSIALLSNVDTYLMSGLHHSILATTSCLNFPNLTPVAANKEEIIWL
jgi:hypothetical protein